MWIRWVRPLHSHIVCSIPTQPTIRVISRAIQPAIMIANHQIDADWWFSWELARAYKLHGRLKIILKVRYSRIYLRSIKQSIEESIRVSRFGASVSLYPTRN